MPSVRIAGSDAHRAGAGPGGVCSPVLKDAKHQALSDPRFCNALNLLSRITQMGLDLLPIPKESSDAEHESDKTHRRPAGLRVLQGLRPRRRLPRSQRHVGSQGTRRGQA